MMLSLVILIFICVVGAGLSIWLSEILGKLLDKD